MKRMIQIGFIAWTALIGWCCVYGINELSKADHLYDATGQLTTAASLGSTLGLLVWFGVWVGGAIVFLVMAHIFRD